MQVKRLGIYYLNDLSGILDTAAEKQLTSLMPFLDDLIVVTPKINDDTNAILSQFTSLFIECGIVSRLSAYDGRFQAGAKPRGIR